MATAGEVTRYDYQIHGGAKSQVFFRNITIEELGEKK